MPQVDNPITEEWRTLFDFANYSAVDIPQAAQLRDQKHVNIRSFYGDDDLIAVATRDVYMLFMDTLTMDDLTTISVQQLDGTITVREGEQWTQGTWERDPARKSWHTVTITCIANTPTLAASIIRV